MGKLFLGMAYLRHFRHPEIIFGKGIFPEKLFLGREDMFLEIFWEKKRSGSE